MISRCFSAFLFYATRLWYTQPKVFIVLAASSSIFVVALLILYQQWQQTEASVSQLNSLRLQAKPDFKAAQSVAPASRIPDLPKFDSAALVDTFNQTASDIALPVDEVSYALEDGTAQPYMRYKVTLTIASKYPLIRRFVDSLSLNQPNVALDSISCTRDDIALSALSCDLAFSAFFRKDGHE